MVPTAITEILYGGISPSGKLPYTIARNESDYGTLVTPQDPGTWGKYSLQNNFTKGVFIDYRIFDENNINPRFEFGLGLTYTTFNYTNLKIESTIEPPTLSFPVAVLISGTLSPP